MKLIKRGMTYSRSCSRICNGINDIESAGSVKHYRLVGLPVRYSDSEAEASRNSRFLKKSTWAGNWDVILQVSVSLLSQGAMLRT